MRAFIKGEFVRLALNPLHTKICTHAPGENSEVQYFNNVDFPLCVYNIYIYLSLVGDQ